MIFEIKSASPLSKDRVHQSSPQGHATLPEKTEASYSFGRK